MTELIHITAFNLGEGGEHGGVRRSMQLSSFAADKGRVTTTLIENKTALRLAILKPTHVLKSLTLIFKLGPSRFTLKGLVVAISQGVWLLDLLKTNIPDDEIWIEVAPGRTMILAAMAGILGRQFIAYPHNVEFLVPAQSQAYFSGPEHEYFIERSVYKSAKEVITISGFDAAVIRSLGVNNVTVFPYFPSCQFREELLHIRDKRRKTVKDGVLILGTVGNVPTREGVRELLGIIADNSGELKYKLAGYGTEIFVDTAPEAVEVLGSVTKDQLNWLLSSCKFLLVKQPQTSGMLTRLVEAEFVGIPVYVLGDYMQADDPSLRMTTRISSLEELPI